MKSDLPKVLHTIGGAPLYLHAVNSGLGLDPSRVVIVTGVGADLVEKSVAQFEIEADIVVQKEQLGTAHAVAQAAPILSDFAGDAVVLYGDTPFIQMETLQKLHAAREEFDVVILGFNAADPARYGRLVMDGDRLERIVEFKDATDDERMIDLCNSGVVMADAQVMFNLVKSVGNDNASEEYYLTDIIGLANSRGLSCGVVRCDEAETLGVNSRPELAAAEAIFQKQKRHEALENGTTLIAPETVFFSHDTHLGRDVIVEPNVFFGPQVTVETGATIRAFSHLEGSHVSTGAIVGPYARLRPGTELSNDAKVGNFVEVKNAIVGDGAKISHLSYIGDAEIGDRANIGAGTITCNYNGVEKFRTEVGTDAFVGSNSMLIAPVRVGDSAMTASGAVITKEVPDGALAITRVAQVNKLGAGRRLFEMYKKAKAKRQKAKE